MKHFLSDEDDDGRLAGLSLRRSRRAAAAAVMDGGMKEQTFHSGNAREELRAAISRRIGKSDGLYQRRRKTDGRPLTAGWR